jgi:riboflavin kinase / FMN adenylyltransferase
MKDRFGPCALAIGNFDGVHIGHQALVREVVRCASEKHLHPAALTFDPHPTAVLAPDKVPLQICTLQQRINLLRQAGIEKVHVLPFTAELAALSPEEFVAKVLVSELETKAVFVGQNFRFGYRQSGTPEVFQALGAQYGFTTCFLQPVRFRGQIVSSSAIREFLANNKVVQAAHLLGRCFTLQEPVVSGHGIGSKQTVPTLNIRPAASQLVPRGVYVSETHEIGGERRWRSITNAGVRPTFGGDELTVETFLLEPLAGDNPAGIELTFRHFVRPERKFASPEELKSQILKDVGRANAYWRRIDKLARPLPSIY